MYGPMYDSKHRFRSFSVNVSDHPQTHQKGIREKLLCHDCEQRFSRYEGHAAKEFYHPALGAMAQLPPPSGFAVTNLEYPRFKLFLLSLLWRFGIANHGQFRPADLGPHFEKLRLMLLNDNPGGWLEYPCMITALTLRGRFYGDFTAGAFSTKQEGLAVWAFVLSGFFFNFFVGSHNPPPILHPFFMQAGGVLQVGVEDIREIDSVYELACDVAGANVARKTAKS
jgi:hypothetical protein